MSDDHALIVDDGQLVPMDPADKTNFKFDWSTSHLNTGVTIATSTMTIRAIAPTTGTGLTKDNESIIAAAPYSSRWTSLRLIAGGDTVVGHMYEVANTIVTDESPAQTKQRSFRVRIEQR